MVIVVIILRRNCDFSEGEVGLTCKSGTDLIPEFDKYNVRYLRNSVWINCWNQSVVCIFVIWNQADLEQGYDRYKTWLRTQDVDLWNGKQSWYTYVPCFKYVRFVVSEKLFLNLRSDFNEAKIKIKSNIHYTFSFWPSG